MIYEYFMRILYNIENMPYTMRKVPKKNCYKVYNSKTKRVFAKCTTKTNAKKQMRLLRAIENNKNFVRKPKPLAGGTEKRKPNSHNESQKSKQVKRDEFTPEEMKQIVQTSIRTGITTDESIEQMRTMKNNREQETTSAANTLVSMKAKDARDDAADALLSLKKTK